MSKFSILRPMALAALLLSLVSLVLAQNQPVAKEPLLKLALVHEADGIFVTASEAVNDFVFEAYLLSGQRVLASAPISAVSLKLALQTAEGKLLPEGQYLYVATSNVSPTAQEKYFGKLTIQSGKAEIQDSGEMLSTRKTKFPCM